MKINKVTISIAILLIAFLCGFVYFLITKPLKNVALQIQSVSTEVKTLNSNFESLVQVQEVGKGKADEGSINLGKAIGGLESGLKDLSGKLNSTNIEFKQLNKEIGNSTLLGF